MRRLGLGNSKSSRIRRNFGNEYLLAREHFRDMFQRQSLVLTTLSDDQVPINPDFIDCTAKCLRNMENYMLAYLSGKKCSISCLTSPNSGNLDMEDLIKTAKKNLRLLPAYMRGDIPGRLSSCDSTESALEILDEIEEVFRNIDYSSDVAAGTISRDKT